jgi:hypothetical protein
VKGKALRSGGEEKQPAGLQDGLHVADDGAPVADVLEHLGRDHDIEGVRTKPFDQLLGGQHLVHTRPRRHVHTHVACGSQRLHVRAKRAIDVLRAYLEDGPAADLR